MIYIIGGASRSGKSLLTDILCDKYGIPFLSVDVLRGGLKHGIPNVLIPHDDGNSELMEARIIWPILRRMILSQSHQGRDYVFEGVWMTPHHIASLIRRYPDKIRACFLGYPTIDLDLKQKHIRKYAGGTNDWLSKNDDAYVARHLRISQRNSLRLQRDCAKHDIPFFDVGHRFKSTLNDAMRYLRTGKKPPKRKSALRKKRS